LPHLPTRIVTLPGLSIIAALSACLALAACQSQSASRVTETVGSDGSRKSSATRISKTTFDWEKAKEMGGGIADVILSPEVAPYLGGGGLLGAVVAYSLSALRGKRKTEREDKLWDEATQTAERKALIGAILGRTGTAVQP
jgi:hypothetical protein